MTRDVFAAIREAVELEARSCSLGAAIAVVDTTNDWAGIEIHYDAVVVGGREADDLARTATERVISRRGDLCVEGVRYSVACSDNDQDDRMTRLAFAAHVAVEKFRRLQTVESRG